MYAAKIEELENRLHYCSLRTSCTNQQSSYALGKLKTKILHRPFLSFCYRFANSPEYDLYQRLSYNKRQYEEAVNLFNDLLKHYQVVMQQCLLLDW